MYDPLWTGFNNNSSSNELDQTRGSSPNGTHLMNGLDHGLHSSHGNHSNENPDLHNSCNLFTFIIYAIVFGIMCVFGLIGNSVSFVVLSWERHSFGATFLLQRSCWRNKSRSQSCTVMACADNLFLLTTAITQIPQAVMDYLLHETIYWLQSYIIVITWPLVHIAQMWTIWITVLIAVNRYIAICWPFKASVLCSLKQARIQVAVIAIATTLYNIPRFFEHTLYYDTTYNSTYFLPTEMKLNIKYNIAYENAFYFLFVFFGPLVILAFLNICLIREMIRARKRLQARQLPTSLNSEDSEHNLNKVMVVIIVIFLVCQTPAFLNQCLFLYFGYDCQGATKYFYFFHLSNLLVMVNSSVNFVVYCVFRRQFRQRLKACCLRTRYDYTNGSSYIYSDSVPLKFHSSRSTSLQTATGNLVGPHSRSTSFQTGYSER